MPDNVASARDVIVPESRFVWPLIAVFKMIENVPVNPPSEMTPLLIVSGLEDARLRVSVAASGPVRSDGNPATLEKTKKIWLEAVRVTPDPVSTR